MKTTELNMIANTQAKEAAAKAAAEKAQHEKELLDNIEVGALNDMLQDLENETITIITNERDEIVGLGSHPHVTGIKVAKLVGGALTVGCCETERLIDEFDYKVFMKKYGMKAQRYLLAALKLQNAGLKPDNIIETRSNFYYILADQKKVIDQDGHTIVDLSTDPKYDGAAKELMIEILNNKTEIYLG